MGRVEVLQGATRCVKAVVVTLVVVVCLPAGRAWDQTYDICPIEEKSFALYPFNKVFIGVPTSDTNRSEVTVRVKSAGCINDKRALNVSQLTSTYYTSHSLRWYEVFFISCERFVAQIGYKVVEFNYENLSSECVNGPVKLSVESGVRLGKKCRPSTATWRDETNSKLECERLNYSITAQSFLNAEKPNGQKDDGFSMLDILKIYRPSDLSFSGDKEHFTDDDDNDKDVKLPLTFDNNDKDVKLPLTFDDSFFDSKEPLYPKVPDGILRDFTATTPSYDFDSKGYSNKFNRYSGRRTYKNAIPIFIGLVAFTITMSLRFCLCRGKTVVRRVTTVTVISRGRSPEAPQNGPDPPPSYIDVVNGTPHTTADGDATEPPPPAYADIVDEVQPPTYSEVEAQSTPTSDEVPLTDHESQDSTTQQPTDSEAAADDRGSAPSKNMLTKLRSQQKQFAFKVLEEDD